MTTDVIKTPGQISKKKFEQAVWQSFGNLSTLAKILGVNYQSLYSYLRLHPELKDLINISRQKLVDDAEDFISTALQDNTLDARTKADLAKFILKSLGKERGWSESPTI